MDPELRQLAIAGIDASIARHRQEIERLMGLRTTLVGKPKRRMKKLTPAQEARRKAGLKRYFATLRSKKHPHHKGLHWTQKPENKAKLQAMTRKAAATRREAA